MILMMLVDNAEKFKDVPIDDDLCWLMSNLVVVDDNGPSAEQ